MEGSDVCYADLRNFEGRCTCSRCQAERIAELEVEVERLREAAREAYEVYAGSDGFIPKTAPEAYQQRLLTQMAAKLGNALKESK